MISFFFQTHDDFESGNYYEVVYSVLKKIFTNKDIEITYLVLDCILNVVRIMPPDLKVYIRIIKLI